MREFALRELTETSTAKTVQDAQPSYRSCVSQRDIQRVFTFYQWFMSTYEAYKPYLEQPCYQRRAVLVAMGIVYYMRLNKKYRKEYREYLDKLHRLPTEVNFSEAFEDELNYYIKKVTLPRGIAHISALKENIFATIVCTMTHTPLIIVGDPGSSKTLSFNQATANLKGQESKVEHFVTLRYFLPLTPIITNVHVVPHPMRLRLSSPEPSTVNAVTSDLTYPSTLWCSWMKLAFQRKVTNLSKSSTIISTRGKCHS